MIQEKDDFTQGRILPKFFRFVLPVLGALLLQAAYGATDLAVVGWFGDKTGTAAVGTGSAVMQLVTVIIAGVTMGATVVIGQLLGERKPEDAGRAIGSSVWLFGGLAVILTILMELLTEPLVRLMNAPEEAFLQTVTYVRICSAGIVLITAYNGISGVFRGLGNSRLPLLFVAIAAAFNVAGDFILVGAFRMDVAGAAIATVAAQGLSVRQTEALVKRLTTEKKEREPSIEEITHKLHAHIAEEELAQSLGRGVKIVAGRKKGRIELDYYDMDDLNDLLDALGTLQQRKNGGTKK